jgi:fructose transport system ATP-binding protein
MITASDTAGPAVGPDTDPVLSARGLVKRYGNVTAIRGSDFDLFPGEVLAIVGDNGAGKSSLIKALTGALIPDSGTITLNGEEIRFGSPADARNRGIETVYQTPAVAPALDIATNLFLGREIRRRGLLGRLHILDRNAMRTQAKEQLDALGIATIQDITQPVESLSGGQRQAVAVARAAMFGKMLVIMDEPTAALGVRETEHVLELIKRIRDKGIPVILISHDMPATSKSPTAYISIASDGAPESSTPNKSRCQTPSLSSPAPARSPLPQPNNNSNSRTSQSQPLRTSCSRKVEPASPTITAFVGRETEDMVAGLVCGSGDEVTAVIDAFADIGADENVHAGNRRCGRCQATRRDRLLSATRCVVRYLLGRGTSARPYARVSTEPGHQKRWTTQLHLRKGGRVGCRAEWDWRRRPVGPA